jgi:hypothetical protein
LIGEGGLAERRDACLAHLNDDDGTCRMWAAWSAVRLGDRANGLAALARAAALHPGGPAFDLALQAMTPSDAHA